MNDPLVTGSATVLGSGMRRPLRSFVATNRPNENAHGPTMTPEYAWSCSYQRLYSRSRSGSRVGSTIVIMACQRSMCVPSAMARIPPESRGVYELERRSEDDFDRTRLAVARGRDGVTMRFEWELMGDDRVRRQVTRIEDLECARNRVCGRRAVEARV